MGTVEWIVLVSVGVLAGLGLGFFLGRLGGRGNSQRLADAEAELDEYRQNVSEHFSQSAAHFQAIGRQYRELYEHMAAGSEKLCVGASSDGQLKFPRPDEVSKEQRESDVGSNPSAEDARQASGNEERVAQDVSADEPSADEESASELKAANSSEEDSKLAEATEDTAPVDLKSGEADDLDSPKAPADYASDDPKDRRYH